MLVSDRMLAVSKARPSLMHKIRRAFFLPTFAVKLRQGQRIKTKEQKPPRPGHVVTNAMANRSMDQMVERLGVSRATLLQIMRGQVNITSDESLKLAEVFKTSPNFWLELQANHDAWQADQKRR